MTLSKTKSRLLQRLRTTKLRAREAAFLVEGVRGAREFLQAWPREKIRWALVSPRLRGLGRGAELEEEMVAAGLSVEEISDAEFASVTDTEQHQGVLMVLDEPGWSLSDLENKDGESRVLLMDGIQDPGNAGTLMRAGAAFGVDGVIALDGTVDLLQPKVVRASAGVMALLKVVRAPWSAVSPWLGDQGLPLLVADSSGTAAPDFRPPNGWALAVGNEGAGSRLEVLEAAEHRLSIPMRGDVESLNAGVAGAILLFALDQLPDSPTEQQTRED